MSVSQCGQVRGQSPDLNPIKNLWRAKETSHDKEVVQYQEPGDLAKQEWAKIPVETCRNLVSKSKGHLEAAIKNKGFAIDYLKYYL